MNPFVSSDDQTLAPLVVRGAIGATVNFRISNGAASVTGTGLVGADGKLSVLVDVSSHSGRHADRDRHADAERADERRRLPRPP